MMRFTILVATALRRGAAPAAAPDGAPAAARTAEEALELAAALDALLADRYPSGRALGLRLDDGEPEVYSVLRKADLAPGDVAAAEHALEVGLELPPTAARPLLESALRLFVLEQKDWDQEPRHSGAFERPEGLALAALASAPWSEPVIDWLAHLYFAAAVGDYDAEAPARLAIVVRDLPDRAVVARRLARKLDSGDFVHPLIDLAIEDEPGSPATLYLAATSSDRALGIALVEAASAALAARPLAPGSRLPLVFAQLRVGWLLEAGLHADALDVIDALAPAIRQGLLAGTEGAVDESLDGLRIATTLEDLRLPLAAMLLLEGEHDRAPIPIAPQNQRGPTPPAESSQFRKAFGWSGPTRRARRRSPSGGPRAPVTGSSARTTLAVAGPLHSPSGIFPMGSRPPPSCRCSPVTGYCSRSRSCRGTKLASSIRGRRTTT
jgi:hypothetical protein